MPNGSVVIEGKGKTIKTINPTSEGFCPTFLSANRIGRIELRNLKVDGGWKKQVTVRWY